MEHLKTGLFFAISLLILAGCKKELEKPEMADPIYLQLEQKSKDYQKQIKGESELLLKAKNNLENNELGAGERTELRNEVQGRTKKITLMEQDQKYAALQARTRADHDRETYAERAAKNLPWPDPQEVAEFEAHERLQKGRTQKWEETVPKLKYGSEQKPPSAESAEKPADNGAE